jgi:hypothetical protein
MKVQLLKIKGCEYMIFQYTYDVNKYIGFTFNQLCEVGGPWQAEAKSMRDTLLAQYNGALSTLEDNDSLYYCADIMHLNKE